MRHIDATFRVAFVRLHSSVDSRLISVSQLSFFFANRALGFFFLHIKSEMGTKVIEYVDTSQLYATNYIRNSKAIAVLWAIFTICYSIIVVVSFVTPGKAYRVEVITLG